MIDALKLQFLGAFLCPKLIGYIIRRDATLIMEESNDEREYINLSISSRYSSFAYSSSGL